jgi:STE24 endopeptidase
MATLLVIVRPVRRYLVRTVQSIGWLGNSGRSALLAAIIVTACELVKAIAEWAMARTDAQWGIAPLRAGAFLKANAVGMGVRALVVFVGVFVALACMRHWKQTWPFKLALASVALVVAASCTPVLKFFSPMHTQAIPAGATRTLVSELKQRAGLPTVSVRQTPASDGPDKVNAYAYGAGPWQGIVVLQGSITDLSQGELASMVAHELGHLKYRDPMVSGLVATGFLGLLILGCGWCATRRGPRRYGHWVVPEMVPALMAIWLIGSLALLPAASAVSRKIEARADQYSLNLTHDPAQFIRMMRIVATENQAYLGNGAPHLWRRTHPTIGQRLAAARQWAQEHNVQLPPLPPARDISPSKKPK